MSGPSVNGRSQPPLRLTRRGRVVLVLVLVLVVLALTAIIVRVPSGAANEPGASELYETVVVQPGETLWSIARRHAPGGDIRATIHEIEELNGLPSGRIGAGQQLLLPSELG